MKKRKLTSLKIKKKKRTWTKTMYHLKLVQENKLTQKTNDSSKVGQGPESEGSDKKSGEELGDHEVVDDLTEGEDKDEEDLDLDEVLRALTEEDKEEEDAEENEKLKAENLKKQSKVIHFMRSKLNEVNLLNAKTIVLKQIV